MRGIRPTLSWGCNWLTNMCDMGLSENEGLPVLFNIAMENGQFIDGLPIENVDFP